MGTTMMMTMLMTMTTGMMIMLTTMTKMVTTGDGHLTTGDGRRMMDDNCDDDSADDFALLHRAAGRGFFHVGCDDIADRGESGFLADDTDHGGHAGAGVVGDVETGAELDHGRISV